MRLVLSAFCLLMGALLFALPNLTRREILFAVPVPPDFRNSPAGRHAVAMYRWAVAAAALAGTAALLLVPANLFDAAATAVPLALLMVSGAGFYRQHRRLALAAVQYTRPQEAEMTVAPDKLPGFAWLAAGPFILLAAAALWLHFHWDLIPLRFPVHFDAAGQPNRWAERTVKGVYGPLFFAAELCAWMLVMALAGWFGARRSRSRRVMLGGMIGVEYFLALLFVLIAVQAPLGFPVWVIVLAPLALLIPLISVWSSKMRGLGEPMDSTPNERWKGAIVYYNPGDAALFVEKRDGLGFTFNFANPWSWVLLLGLALVIASGLFVLG
jgi:uncharacterized membrane protein